MIQIDAKSGFWTIKHLTCGASFEINTDKLINSKNQFKCPNCGIPFCDSEMLKRGVDKFDIGLRDIERSTKSINDPYDKLWEIHPPIKIIEEDY